MALSYSLVFHHFSLNDTNISWGAGLIESDSHRFYLTRESLFKINCSKPSTVQNVHSSPCTWRLVVSQCCEPAIPKCECCFWFEKSDASLILCALWMLKTSCIISFILFIDFMVLLRGKGLVWIRRLPVFSQGESSH